MKTIPYKVAFLSWLTFLNQIQTVDKLLPKGVVVEDECVICHCAGETTNHLVVQYSVIKSICDTSLSCFNFPLVNVKEALTKVLFNGPLSSKGK